MRRAALLALPLAFALSACGDDDPTPQATQTPSATVTTTAPTATASATASLAPPCPSRTSPAPDTTLVTASVAGKNVTAPSREVTVKVGTRVRVEITSDVADEVHVHTYDLRENVVPGCPSAIEFVANIPGTVEVELEKAHVHVVEIKATP